MGLVHAYMAMSCRTLKTRAASLITMALCRGDIKEALTKAVMRALPPHWGVIE